MDGGESRSLPGVFLAPEPIVESRSPCLSMFPTGCSSWQLKWELLGHSCEQLVKDVFFPPSSFLPSTFFPPPSLLEPKPWGSWEESPEQLRFEVLLYVVTLW